MRRETIQVEVNYQFSYDVKAIIITRKKYTIHFLRNYFKRVYFERILFATATHSWYDIAMVAVEVCPRWNLAVVLKTLVFDYTSTNFRKIYLLLQYHERLRYI